MKVIRGQRSLPLPLRDGSAHEPCSDHFSRVKLTQLYVWAAFGVWMSEDELLASRKEATWDPQLLEKWAEEHFGALSVDSSVVTKTPWPGKAVGGEE
jgi:hypothetical protein